MSFISSIASYLASAPQAIEKLLTSNPTIVKIESYFPTIILVLLTKTETITVDGYTVTAKINGTPTSFTFASAVLAVESILNGKSGTFTCGSVEIDIVPPPPHNPMSAPTAA